MGRKAKLKLETEQKKIIAERLREALKNSKYKSQSELAKELNISRSSMSRMFVGDESDNSYSIPNMIALSKALGVRIDYLLGGEYKYKDLSLEDISKKTGLSEAAIDKIINHISYDNPALYKNKIWCLDQLICSIGFEAFLEKFNNYLAFNYDKEYEKYFDNKVKNALDDSKKEMLPEADDIRYRIERELTEYSLYAANLTEYKYQFNLKMADYWKKKMDELKDSKHIPYEDYETYPYAKERFDYYNNWIVTYQNKKELQESMEKVFDNFLEYQEEANKHFQELEESMQPKTKEKKRNGKK